MQCNENNTLGKMFFYIMSRGRLSHCPAIVYNCNKTLIVDCQFSNHSANVGMETFCHKYMYFIAGCAVQKSSVRHWAVVQVPVASMTKTGPASRYCGASRCHRILRCHVLNLRIPKLQKIGFPCSTVLPRLVCQIIAMETNCCLCCHGNRTYVAMETNAICHCEISSWQVA